jgi:RNA 3'-terminal phosphate cyclase (ATP)
VRGGTHVPFSPPVHFVEHVLLPALARLGVSASIAHVHWGYYPIGGGTVIAHTDGNARLAGVDLTDRGGIRSVAGLATASNLPSHIPQRISARANNRLKELGLRPAIEPQRVGEVSTGVGLSVAVSYENGLGGFSALGERGKPSEAVADEALDALAAHHEHGAAVDPHLADQLLVAMALADGPSALSTSAITLHTLTNIAVIGQFLPGRLTVEGEEGQPGTIRAA